MLLIRNSSFKVPKKQLKKLLQVSVLLMGILGGVALTLRDAPLNISSFFGDVFSDMSAIVLAIIEKPFTSLRGYQASIQRHLYLQKNAAVLEALMSQLKTADHKIQSLEMRNRELQELLSLQGVDADTFITTPCFGQTFFLDTRALFIHAGKDQTLKRYDVVLSEGTIIGQVDHVGTHTSRVLLINDPQSKIPVVGEHSQQEGILTGDDEGNLYLKFVSKPDRLVPGEFIFSSGVDGIFPRGKPLGKVGEAKPDTVRIIPLLDLKSLRYVQIQKIKDRHADVILEP